MASGGGLRRLWEGRQRDPIDWADHCSLRTMHVVHEDCNTNPFRLPTAKLFTVRHASIER